MPLPNATEGGHKSVESRVGKGDSMKRTSKGYLYKGYELNRDISKNMMTLCNQMWGWKIVDPKTGMTIDYFEKLRDAKAFIERKTA